MAAEVGLVFGTAEKTASIRDADSPIPTSKREGGRRGDVEGRVCVVTVELTTSRVAPLKSMLLFPRASSFTPSVQGRATYSDYAEFLDLELPLRWLKLGIGQLRLLFPPINVQREG